MTPPLQLNLLRRIARDLGLLAGLILDFARGRYRQVSPRAGVALILALTYLLVPTDLVADMIPGLGQLDDAAVLLGCLFFIEKDLFRYRDWKQGRLPGQPPVD